MRVLVLFFLIVLVISALATPTFAQDPVETPTPDPQEVLKRADAAASRADEVASLTYETAQQIDRVLVLIQVLGVGIGAFVVLATIVLGLYGYNTQRGFQDTKRDFQDSLVDYRAQLNRAHDSYLEMLSLVRSEQEEAQRLRTDMTQKVQEIETVRQELDDLKQEVSEEFTAAKQALVLLGVGNRFYNEGKRERAIELYEEARRLQPDDPHINYYLGRTYSNAADFDKAIKAFEKAVDARPNFAEAYMEMGLAYRRHAENVSSAEERVAEYRLAERFLKRAIDLRSDYGDALGALGGLYRREGRLDEALKCYVDAAAVDPNLSYYHNNIASISWYLGEVDMARRSFESVEQIASERIESGIEEETYWDYYDRALARLALDQQEEAIKDHKFAIARTPEPENYRSVLDNLRFLQRAPETIEGIDEFIELIEARLHKKEDDQAFE